MGDFTKFINTDMNTTPFQMVVFGAKSPLLEVELNEAQSILYEKMRTAFREFIGNRMKGSVTFSGSVLNVNAVLCVEGYIFKCDNLEIPAAAGNTYYINLSMGEANHSSTVRKDGYVDGEVITNTIVDTRKSIETTRRKVLEFSISDSADSSFQIHVPLCSIADDGSLETMISPADAEKSSFTLTKVLPAGSTSLVFNSSVIHEDSMIDTYTDVYSVSPKSASVVEGTLTYTFKEQSQDVKVRVVINNGVL